MQSRNVLKWCRTVTFLLQRDCEICLNLIQEFSKNSKTIIFVFGLIQGCAVRSGNLLFFDFAYMIQSFQKTQKTIIFTFGLI